MILAIDTSLGTSVAVVQPRGIVFGAADASSRGHAEQLGPMLEAALDGRRASIQTVVAGMGPGAFTGLRVGIAAARGAAMALGVPFRGVLSHLGAPGTLDDPAGSVQVTTDVRRRERAWSVIDGFQLIDGPHLAAADHVPDVGLRRIDADRIDAARLGFAAFAGASPVEGAVYLREADAVPSAGPKRVSQPPPPAGTR